MKLVIDGHTGSGKTTLARLISKQCNWEYVKPYDGTTGAITRWLHERGDTSRLNAFRETVDTYSASSAPTNCVFDRLGPSTVSLLPIEDWPNALPLQESTVILHASLATTLTRVQARGRNTWTQQEHADFLEIFKP